MNYRHIYHAGNLCDVMKHAVLSLLITQLHAKEKGCFILDTHAGIGLYDLQDERAQKTSEAQDGIIKFLNAPALPELAAYYNVLKHLNPSWQAGSADRFRYYPGSPLLAQYMLRPQDRLVACELHPEDVEQLRHFAPMAQIHHRDGYAALQAFLPPQEKRGLVLIDPPFEVPDEFQRLPQIMHDAWRRWPTGQFALWHPIKERPVIWQLHESLIANQIPKMLCVEFVFDEEIRHDRLNGSGLILINPPYQIDEKLQQLLPKLHQMLGTKHHGVTVKWLTPEITK